MADMTNEVLLRFLAIGVIDVGGDDTKLEKLQATVEDLRLSLSKAPATASIYTMVAADPDVPATDPMVQDAMTVLKKHWTTVANTFSTTPVAIIRAMLLDATVRAARRDDAIALAFVNSARNALPQVESGNEQPIWEEVVNEIEAKVDERAEAEWATPEMIKIDPLNYKSEPISVGTKRAKVDRDTLYAEISRAAGPWAGGDANRYYPHNNVQAWGTEFANRLSAAIADAVDGALAGSVPKPIDLATPLNGLVEVVSAHVEKALAAFGGATAGLQRRTNLLWWKEALYSPKAHISYRDLPAFDAAAMMALDLHRLLPIYSPASVSAFLNEAIQLLPAVGAAKDKAMLELLTDARATDIMAPLREAAVQLTRPALGRGPLLSLIGHTTNPAELNAPALRRLGGVGAGVMLSPPAWGTWLFRELQAARSTDNSGAKRQRRKG